MAALEGEQLTFLEKTVKLIEKYGMWKIAKALIVIFLFVFIMLNASAIGDGFNKFLSNIIDEAIAKNNVEKVESHNKALAVRQENGPKINDLLNNALIRLDADRAFVLELHNGTNNTAGLPFLYGAMTYETVCPGVTHIDEDYANVNLSRFQFPYYLEKHHIWLGSIDEFKAVDEKLALRLISNDVTYLAIVQIHGVYNELGYFGISYCNGRQPKSKDEIIGVVMEISQKCSSLLDVAPVTSEEADETSGDGGKDL